VKVIYSIVVPDYSAPYFFTVGGKLW